MRLPFVLPLLSYMSIGRPRSAGHYELSQKLSEMRYLAAECCHATYEAEMQRTYSYSDPLIWLSLSDTLIMVSRSFVAQPNFRFYMGNFSALQAKGPVAHSLAAMKWAPAWSFHIGLLFTWRFTCSRNWARRCVWIGIGRIFPELRDVLRTLSFNWDGWA